MFCNGTSWVSVVNFQNTGNVGIGTGTATPGALLDIGKAGTTLGTMRLEGNTSGYVQLQPAAAAGSWTMTLPATAGSSGQVLTTDGTGITSWAAGPTTLSSITAATAGSTINNAGYAQVWNWNSLTTGTALSLASSSVTTGTLLNLKNSNTTGASFTLTAENTSTSDGATAIYGVSSNATGVTKALMGRTYSSGGLGVYGRSEVAGGTAVSGESVATTGYATGVSGAASSTGQGIGVYATAYGTNNTGQAAYVVNNSATGWGVYSSGTSPNYFAGNVGIGTTTPTKGGLVVNQQAGLTWAMFGQGQYGLALAGGTGSNEPNIGFNMYYNGGWYSSGGGHGGIIGVSPSTGSMYFLTEPGSPAADAAVSGWVQGLTIDKNGQVGILNASPGSALDVTGDIHYSGVIVDTSDRRMKRDIKPLPSGQLDRLMRLKPVSFVMKDDKKRRTELGFIAQDTQPVYPELILTDPKGMHSMNYVGLIAPMVAAMQEQQAELDDLKAEHQDLSARIDAVMRDLRSQSNR